MRGWDGEPYEEEERHNAVGSGVREMPTGVRRAPQASGACRPVSCLWGVGASGGGVNFLPIPLTESKLALSLACYLKGKGIHSYKV